MADVADTHNKIALFGKSAQRHLDALRAFVIRECQNLFDLTTKTCSVVFDAVREVSKSMKKSFIHNHSFVVKSFTFLRCIT